MSETQTLRVAFTQRPKDYDILVGEGLLHKAGDLIRARAGERRCLIVTDKNVAALHLEKLETSLQKGGHLLLPSIAVEPGEASKSWPVLQELTSHIFDRLPDRDTLLVALGGGVIGDLTGFAAAIVLRGIDFVQIPTTLLAQVDSSVGGKTGIDSLYGKNTIGAFHQPRLVLSDIATLDTLPLREMKAGYAETVKHGIILDKAFFDWCEKNGKALIDGDKAARAAAVAASCRIKADIVAKDEREAGPRALLNLGHTFAHALEGALGYDGQALLHGEAVAIGIVMALDLSAQMGLCPPRDAEAVRRHFYDLDFSLKPPVGKEEVERLMILMAQDKKAKTGALTLILAHGIGECFVARDVPADPIRALWRKMLG